MRSGKAMGQPCDRQRRGGATWRYLLASESDINYLLVESDINYLLVKSDINDARGLRVGNQAQKLIAVHGQENDGGDSASETETMHPQRQCAPLSTVE
jgi:hypothetical protein